MILFLADDLGFGDLACHGNPHIKTPQLDAFSREAVEFTQFRVIPMCSPTRASLMTGRYNFRTGVYGVHTPSCEMDPAETTVAESLRRVGYKTGLFGKWHLGFGIGQSPNRRGVTLEVSKSEAPNRGFGPRKVLSKRRVWLGRSPLAPKNAPSPQSQRKPSKKPLT